MGLWFEVVLFWLGFGFGCFVVGLWFGVLMCLLVGFSFLDLCCGVITFVGGLMLCFDFGVLCGWVFCV